MTAARQGERIEDATPADARGPAAAARPDRLACLDGWRGLAIALVLIGHFVPVAGWGFDSAGVDVFFVLSGRLIAGILFAEEAPLGHFVWRRISRLGPSLVAYVLLAGPLHALLLGRKVPDLVPPLTATANYVYAAWGEPPFFGHLWSLCVEDHSYLALVIIALVHRRRGGGAAAMIVALGLFCLLDLVVSEMVFQQRDFAVLWRTDARAGSLILSGGMHLVMRGRLASWRRRPASGALPLLAFAAGLALYRDEVPQVIQYSLGGLFLGLAVNTLEAAPAAVLRQLTSPPLLALGRWSYSIYLWQQPFFVLACFADPVWHLPMMAASTGAGLLNLRLVEQPARRGLDRVWSVTEGWRAPVRTSVSDGAA